MDAQGRRGAAGGVNGVEPYAVGSPIALKGCVVRQHGILGHTGGYVLERRRRIVLAAGNVQPPFQTLYPPAAPAIP